MTRVCIVKREKAHGKEARDLLVGNKNALQNILILMNHEDPNLDGDQDCSPVHKYDAYDIPSDSTRISGYVLILVFRHL